MPKLPRLHSWELEPTEARGLQAELAGQVASSTPLSGYKTIAGSDVSFDRGGEWLFATVVVLKAGTFELIERTGVVTEAKFPYIPGLLSFREAPAVIEAFEALHTKPDVMICDGQGTAHPLRLGLASHVGLWVGIPTIGCAKSRLCGKYEEPGQRPGDWTPLRDRDETVGAVLRTRANVKPLFVSPGHLCNLDGAIEVVISSIRKYRLPIPTRRAHEYVNELRVRDKPDATG